MKSYSSYAGAFIYGLYFYLLFQLVFLVRFGQVNFGFTYLDVGLWIVGIVSVLIATYFCKKLTKGKWWLLVPFFLALPLSFFGALLGGLFGLLALLVFGIIPFAALMPLGYWLIARLSSSKKF